MRGPKTTHQRLKIFKAAASLAKIQTCIGRTDPTTVFRLDCHKSTQPHQPSTSPSMPTDDATAVTSHAFFSTNGASAWAECTITGRCGRFGPPLFTTEGPDWGYIWPLSRSLAVHTPTASWHGPGLLHPHVVDDVANPVLSAAISENLTEQQHTKPNNLPISVR